MKTQDVLIVHPSTKEQVTVLEAFLNSLKIKFEYSKDKEYDPEFVKKIEESRKQAKEGKITRVEKADLKEFLGI